VIELVAMQNQELSTVGSPVMKLFCNFHHSALLNESQNHRAAKKVIVIANGQPNTCSTFGQIHQTSDNLIAFGLPVPATLQTPTVNEVADKVKILRFMSIEKLQERLNP
jgi:hypothetical protein